MLFKKNNPNVQDLCMLTDQTCQLLYVSSHRDNDPRIGDLMKKNAPFLKMYTVYISNYNTAMNLINQWMDKSAKFAAIVQEIQVRVLGVLSEIMGN